MKRSSPNKEAKFFVALLNEMQDRVALHDRILMDLICTLSRELAFSKGDESQPFGFVTQGSELREYALLGCPAHVDGVDPEDLKQLRTSMIEFFDVAIERLGLEQGTFDRAKAELDCERPTTENGTASK
jgi:hypothetical protein